jgi:hypothetical protein
MKENKTKKKAYLNEGRSLDKKKEKNVENNFETTTQKKTSTQKSGERRKPQSIANLSSSPRILQGEARFHNKTSSLSFAISTAPSAKTTKRRKKTSATRVATGFTNHHHKHTQMLASLRCSERANGNKKKKKKKKTNLQNILVSGRDLGHLGESNSQQYKHKQTHI